MFSVRNETYIVALHSERVKDKAMHSDAEKEIIAVAMSGGVDSAVTAALLAKAGLRCFGITAKMTQEYSRCCADEDIVRAADMCRQLGIEHHVVDVCDPFQQHVIDGFTSSYLQGETPSPCVICNREIKFGALLEDARKLGATALATGHYVQREERDDIWYLRRGVDQGKDQSYFLARLNREQLARARFPLGGRHKREVSQLAADFELAARKSRESQELCFVTEGTHGDWIDLRSFETRGAGDIVDMEGNVLGRHKGIHHYTIGQRKGLGVATGYPVYVARIDADNNRIVLGPREAIMGSRAILRDVMWVAGEKPVSENLSCQIRYNHRSAPCLVSTEGVEAIVDFVEPQFAITPGQLTVFYEDDIVVGSGWIK